MEDLCCKLKPLTQPSAKAKVLIGIVMLISLAITIPLTVNLIYLRYEWINVHLIPHTHDDVGWLKTPEEYYHYYVRYILDHVIIELQKNSFRRFVYVETYFFWKWWQEQSEIVRAVVRHLIKNKQLEIIGGGICMSDEAVTYYQSFIDQSTWGFRFLNDTFGPIACPTTGWQIDTFGHSKGIASLLAQMGFDSLFFARVDLQERKYRKGKKLMEFVWWGNENLGESSSLFTSIFYDHYSAPKGFDFETESSQTGIDFSSFSNYIRKHAKNFKTNNVLVPMGDDFRYLNARKYFQKMDELIKFFRDNTDFKLNVFYSTPSIYIQNLRESDVEWPEKHGDFFPYASEVYAYWTGYFTSRPTIKYFERISNNFLQISKQLLVFSDKGTEFFDELSSLREAVAVVQHHDAITGTAQQHVTNNYMKLLHDGIKNCEHPINVALGKLSGGKSDNFPKPIYTSCLLLNISSCDVTENSSKFVVTVYNSLSRNIDHYVRIPVTGDSYLVRTNDGTELKIQIVGISKFVRNIPGRLSTAKSELIFKASNIPAMGFKSFYVCKDDQIRSPRKSQKIINFANLKAIFNGRSQLLSGLRAKSMNISVTHKIKFYESARDWSGPYLFKPVGNTPYYPGDRVTTNILNSGDIVKEYEQVFSEWVSQIIRTYQEEDFVEFEWLIGPIPVSDNIGKEVVSQYSSDINSGDVFYTDINGMEMEKRVRDYREWSGKISKTVSGNYYPVTSMISVEDDDHQIFIVVDRPQGGTSLRSGEIELMIHRRLCYDDGRGVEEPLNETAFGAGLVVRGRHWLLFGRKDSQMDQRAKLFAQMRHSEPWTFFFDASSLTYDDWRSNYITEFSGLYSYVPRNVRILTLEPWREDTVLLRLENIFKKVPMSSLSNAPVVVYLKELFKNFEVCEARETTLGADRWLSDTKRLKWRTSAKVSLKREKNYDELLQNLTISLKPQQIRTFIVKIKAKV